MLNSSNQNKTHESDDLRSILGSLCYLEKEAHQAQLDSVQQILNEAISKIKDYSTTDFTVNSFNKELNLDNFVPVIEFFKLIQKLDANDINEIVLAITNIRTKPH